MTRDDGSLYSGITSVTQNRQEKRAKERKDAKQDKRLQLAPFAEIVAAELQKEVKKLMYGPYIDEEKMSDEQFRTERRARRLAVESIFSVQSRLNNLLRQDGRTPTNPGV